ncbi:MAG: hypothetical protein QUS12_00590 [Methanosarcina sp.]|nr:hypothetical protein [Methanosarcina sp.]
MKIIEELLKHVRNFKYFPEVAFAKNKSTITEDYYRGFPIVILG